MSRRRTSPTVLDRLEFAGYRLFRLVMWLLGRRRTTALVAWVARRLGPVLPMAKRAHENLQARRPELDDAERKRIIVGLSDNFTRLLLEYLRLKELYAKQAEWRVEGEEHLEAATAAAGGRMVVVSAHYGNWEAIRAAAGARGAPLALIYRAFNNPLIDAEAQRCMAPTGQPVFHKGKHGARALFAHVSRKGGAMILVDQRLGGAPLIDFMGAPAETSLAAAQMAQRIGVPLLPAVARREGEGFVVRFEQPVEAETPEAAMAEVNARIEAWIDEAPEQWFWLHRRWKIRAVTGGKVRKASARQEANSDTASPGPT
ncbi:MAG: lysophospholipid acyltransferase family protein [Pseudomonadota bacterium]